MRHTSRRALLALAATIVMVFPLAGTATAASSSHGKSSGQTASADWVEYGELPGVGGNVHVGFLYVDVYSSDGADIFGMVTDWTCDPGEEPGWGGHEVAIEDEEMEEEEPVEDLCDFESDRFISNEDATFSMNRKGTQASLVGPLRVEGHDGGDAAFPQANMTWTAIGSTYTYRASESFSDGTYSYTYRYTFTGADAAIGGTIGAMGFNDDEDDESFGSLGTYRNMYRERIR